MTDHATPNLPSRDFAATIAAGVPEARGGQPRLQPAAEEDSGMRIAYLVDPDGSLVRMVQN